MVGIVNGNWVLMAHDSEYPVGKVGLYTRALTEAMFYEGLNRVPAPRRVSAVLGVTEPTGA